MAVLEVFYRLSWPVVKPAVKQFEMDAWQVFDNKT
jgi:hypothetical protein